MGFIQELENQAALIRGEKKEYRAGGQLITLKVINVGDMIDIQPIIVKIQLSEEINSPAELYDADISKYAESIKKVLDIAIIGEYDFKSLLPIDMMNLLAVIVKDNSTQSFTNSITLLSRLSRNQTDSVIVAEKSYSTQ